MWGFAGPFGRLFRFQKFTNLVIAACVILYVATLVLDPVGALRPRGPFDLFSPTHVALTVFGMTSGAAWDQGRWWTLITAIYLHGNLLHILFNMLWIYQLGPAVENLYGRARFVVIFTVAGVAGFLVSDYLIGVPTIGASGSIFGLLGAMVAYGRKRGGTFGAMVLRQYGQWAVLLFIMSFFMSGVNNFAHAGGFVGGLVAGLVLSFEDQRAETFLDELLAFACLAATVGAFALAVWTAFSR